MVRQPWKPKTWDTFAHGESFLHSEAKRLIAETLTALGMEPQIEFVVNRGADWPWPRRIDVALPEQRIAFEVQVRKGSAKTPHAKWRAGILEELGWKVVFLELEPTYRWPKETSRP